jgi:predicted DNA-binding protein with PD1-like motif
VIYRQTRLTRVIEVTLEPGERLPEALVELARWEKVDAARVRGHGQLASAELESAGERHTLDGPLEVESLLGLVRVGGDRADAELHAVLVRRGAGGPELVAGALVAARAERLALVLDVLDDAALEWSFDPATGRRR